MNNRIIRLIAVSGAALALSSCTAVSTVDNVVSETFVPSETAAGTETAENQTETAAGTETAEPPAVSAAEQPEEMTGEAASETAEEQTEEAAEEPPAVSLEMPEDYVLSGSCRLDVETVLQNPELPTGCEITSLDTVLRYNGFDIDKVELCDNYLKIEYNANYTFDEAYIGDPKSTAGFGCYSPVITEAANKFFSDNDAGWKALDISGTPLHDLFYQLEMGRPVVVWSSMSLLDVTWKYQWTTDDGDEAWFPELEHCMVLTGYDLNSGVVYAADPLKGSMEYSMDRFEYIYNEMKQQAVIVYDQGE